MNAAMSIHASAWPPNSVPRWLVWSGNTICCRRASTGRCGESPVDMWFRLREGWGGAPARVSAADLGQEGNIHVVARGLARVDQHPQGLSVRDKGARVDPEVGAAVHVQLVARVVVPVADDAEGMLVVDGHGRVDFDMVEDGRHRPAVGQQPGAAARREDAVSQHAAAHEGEHEAEHDQYPDALLVPQDGGATEGEECEAHQQEAGSDDVGGVALHAKKLPCSDPCGAVN